MSLEFRIEKVDAFRVVGVVLHTTMENNVCMKEVPSLWENVIKQGTIQEIGALSNQKPFGIIGVNSYNTDAANAKKFDYYIASATDKQVPDGMTEYVVPAATWAIFPCKSTEVASVEVRIITEWQPTADYEVLNTGYETGEMKSMAPDLEVHGQDDYAEVWVAVRKK
jgi:AraC family transcriptional regulator